MAKFLVRAFLHLIVAASLSAPLTTAQAQVAISPLGEDVVHAGEFVVPVNKSQVLRVDQPFTELLIGNPEIADVVALTNQTVYVLGKRLGTTNLTIYGPRRQLLAVLDLVVSYDVESLKAKLHEVMPGEAIEVRPVSGGILLSGVVSNATSLSDALAIAQQYAPQSVTNAMSVQGSQQVMLQVKFAEVSRNVVRELGIGHDLIVAGDVGFRLITSSALPIATGSLPFGIGALDTGGNPDLQTTFQTLEQNGLARTLAEPTLIALSGDTASFLAGGEFPIPVESEDDTITIEFKEFGVGLGFTPTVIGKDLINLVVAPEVSRIDPSISVQTTLVTVPGLSTRRAKTTVELRDGQSFAIAGLLQQDYQNAISGLPWLSDIPILGALFRSTGFQRNETELVILVTPRLVKPAPSMADLATPVDRLVLPSDAELFLFGQTEGKGSGTTPQAPGVSAVPSGADALSKDQVGFSGSYGYILE
ncbi:type II and III secretion system protein family protein [Dongia deserti]|uniref:type II and III secretion system protein family protein n=1 Tax=Dongia deserti TaxID=2268030 RepID=UPI000E646177|nr:type II and III secretion system protein family protein [Dongia deserti]